MNDITAMGFHMMGTVSQLLPKFMLTGHMLPLAAAIGSLWSFHCPASLRPNDTMALCAFVNILDVLSVTVYITA